MQINSPGQSVLMLCDLCVCWLQACRTAHVNSKKKRAKSEKQRKIEQEKRSEREREERNKHINSIQYIIKRTTPKERDKRQA